MRHAFLLSDHDCGEEVPVEIERRVSVPSEPGWEAEWYVLVSWPSTCTCGRPMPLMEASQEDLRAAYALPESEEV